MRKSDIKMLAQDNVTLIWADTFAIDDGGDFLWVTTRGWPIDANRNSVVRICIGSESYLYDA